jgi:hypothetical protein
MTAVDRTEAIAALLAETETAHGAYETTELKGVFDQDWPNWYAAYALEHGIADLIGRPMTADELAGFLASAFVAFKQIKPEPSEGWAAHTARRIAVEL